MAALPVNDPYFFQLHQDCLTDSVPGSYDPRFYQGQNNDTNLQPEHISPVTAFRWPEQLVEELGSHFWF